MDNEPLRLSNVRSVEVHSIRFRERPGRNYSGSKVVLQTRFLRFKSKITERERDCISTSLLLTLSKTSTFIHISLLLLPVAQQIELLPCSIPFTTSWSYLQIVLLSRNETPTWNSQAGSLGPGVCLGCKVGWSNGGLLAVISSHIPPKITKGGFKPKPSNHLGCQVELPCPPWYIDMIWTHLLGVNILKGCIGWFLMCHRAENKSPDSWKTLYYLYLSRIYHFCSCIYLRSVPLPTKVWKN